MKTAIDNEVNTRLIIFGFDGDPDEITRAVGLEPTKIVIKGEVWRTDPNGVWPPQLHEESCWIRQLDIPASKDADEHIELALQQLEPYAKGISEMTGRYNGELSVYGFAHYASRIRLDVQREWVKALAELNINLDVDVYPIADDEEE